MDTIIELLEEHLLEPVGFAYQCSCGEHIDSPAAHRAHLAGELLGEMAVIP